MAPAPSSRGEIILVRHGRSAHVERRWLTVDGVRQWIDAYDAAALAPGDAPPPPLVRLAAGADVVVASDLPRAAMSATLLVGAERVVLDPRLREAPLETSAQPLPRLGGVRLPLGGWALVIGARWMHARLRRESLPGVDASVLARADAAAEWLASLAAPGRRVVAVTHTTFRIVLSAALVRREWTRLSRRTVRTWSGWHHVAGVRDAAPGRPA